MKIDDDAFRCARCDAWPMKIVSVTPKVATFPELLTLRCGYCGHIITRPKEDESRGPTD